VLRLGEHRRDGLVAERHVEHLDVVDAHAVLVEGAPRSLAVFALRAEDHVAHHGHRAGVEVLDPVLLHRVAQQRAQVVREELHVVLGVEPALGSPSKFTRYDSLSCHPAEVPGLGLTSSLTLLCSTRRYTVRNSSRRSWGCPC
jgi:hypothetical protein